jgi:hypothetical protein
MAVAEVNQVRRATASVRPRHSLVGVCVTQRAALVVRGAWPLSPQAASTGILRGLRGILWRLLIALDIGQGDGEPHLG